MCSIIFLNSINNIFELFNQLFLIILGSVSVFFSFLIIGSKNPIHAIFSLILTFITVVFIMIGYLECEFLSIVFLIVYVGAVSILFLFIIMLLNIKNIDLTDKFFNYFPVGIAIAILFLVEIYLYIYLGLFTQKSDLKMSFVYIDFINKIDSLTDIEIIAQLLYEEYFLVFIIASILLLIAMIGAIVLTLRVSIKVKKQKINLQVYRKVHLKIKNKIW